MKKFLFGMLFALALIPFCASTAFAAESENTQNLPYIIEAGSEYYESSFGFGSGRHGTVEPSNPYTTEPCYAGINGYSYLDANGYVIIHDYQENEVNILIPEAPENTAELFLHFRSTIYSNGWTSSENVTACSSNTFEEEKPHTPHTERPEEQEAQDIVEQIQAEVKNTDETTAIVIDFSGSMSDNQREVVELLETIEFTDNTTIIAFADIHAIITPEQLSTRDFYVGGGTFMFSALSAAIKLDIENLIIISDLETYDFYNDITLASSDTLKYVTAYDPDDSFEDATVENLFNKAWPDAEISRVRIRSKK